MNKKLLTSYKNGNYRVIIFEDGTKIRYSEENEFKPEYPESLDITITKKCSEGCPFCYANCSIYGEEGNLFHPVLNSLRAGMEVAINGNDMDHPYLVPFLTNLRENGIIVNLTINQNQFMKNYEFIKNLSESKTIRGIGISLQNSYDEEFIERIRHLPNVVLHVVNGIFTESDIQNLLQYDWIKLLILGYKNTGRGIEYKKCVPAAIKLRQEVLQSYLVSLMNSLKVVAFDNLALEQLNVKNLISKEQWDKNFMGDDGIAGEYTSASFYLDLVDNIFSVNSMSKEVFPITNNIKDMFDFLKERYNG